MIERAKKAVIDSGLQEWDIELRVADMGESQLPGQCADVIISNCVINLCPDKDAVYEEAFTPPPKNENLEIVQGKVDSVKFTAIKPPSA